jgi:hypothetical protein
MKTKYVEFHGERFKVPAGSNPTSIAQAQRMQKSLNAPESPVQAPSKPKATRTPGRASSPPKARSSASQGTRRNSQDVEGDPRSFRSPIGASRPSTQPRTQGAPAAYESGRREAERQAVTRRAAASGSTREGAEREAVERTGAGRARSRQAEREITGGRDQFGRARGLSLPGTYRDENGRLRFGRKP